MKNFVSATLVLSALITSVAFSANAQNRFVNHDAQEPPSVSVEDDFSNFSSEETGSALYNDGNILNILGNYNQNTSTNPSSGGGAIGNEGTIQSIIANFIGNSYKDDSHASTGGGGAIYNNGTIVDIQGQFDANSSDVSGGAIYNEGDITNIKGEFTNNTSQHSSARGGGGAIANHGTIGTIDANFSNNSYTSTQQDVTSGGGAIYNYETISHIKGTFDSNKSNTSGGAIANQGAIDDIYATFKNNVVNSINTNAYGGAIYNYRYNSIGLIQSDFENNKILIDSYNGSYAGEILGGAIYNAETINDIVNSNFTANAVEFNDTKDLSSYDVRIGGGAIANNDEMKNITNSVFKDNSVTSLNANVDAYGGAIYNNSDIGKQFLFETDTVKPYGGITNSLFTNNSVKSEGNAYGGAIANLDYISEIRNSNFYNNYAQAGNKAYGGAIYTSKSLRITADNATSTFDSNYTISQNGEKVNNAIYVDGKGVSYPPLTLEFYIKNSGNIVLNDNIDGNNYEVLFTGDNSSNVYLNNTITNARYVTVAEANLNLGRDDAIDGIERLYFEGGKISMINGSAGKMTIDELRLYRDSDLEVDVDLANEKMDTIEAGSYFYYDELPKIHVSNLNIISSTDKDDVKIYFASEDLAKHVDYTGKTPVAYSKLYRYNVAYSIDDEDKMGYFNFSRAGGSSYDIFNPSAFAAPVAAQIGGYLTMLNSFDEAFRNMDYNMLMPRAQRQAMKIQRKMKNKYAYSSDDLTYYDDYDNKRVWARPYTTIEKVPLKNGPKVNNVSYGSYFGTESDVIELANGADFVWGAYLGYNGSRQKYDSVTMYQNGGTLGALGMYYKGDFYTGLTVNAGASAVSSNSMWGDDSFGMFMTGVASKSGYNFEFKEGKFIIQPNLLMSYSFVNTFDYTSASGVKTESDGLHAFHLEPGIRFAFNLSNGWQPYLGASFVWNFIDKTHYKANDVSLPSLSIKPYVKYGVGISKKFSDRFSSYAQTYITNGGRNGIGFQLGLNWFY